MGMHYWNCCSSCASVCGAVWSCGVQVFAEECVINSSVCVLNSLIPGKQRGWGGFASGRDSGSQSRAWGVPRAGAAPWASMATAAPSGDGRSHPEPVLSNARARALSLCQGRARPGRGGDPLNSQGSCPRPSPAPAPAGQGPLT